MEASELIQLLKTNEFILLDTKYLQGYRIIATEKNTKACAGATTFSEFKRGLDASLKGYLQLQIRNGFIQRFQKPWLIRIMNAGNDYDWTWTGGETFVLQNSGSGSQVVECYLIGAEPVQPE